MNSTDKYVAIINEICMQDSALGKKKLQKLMYLIERKGVEINLDYKIHFYGPYSSKLDNTIQYLFAKDIIDIDSHGSKHIIRAGQSMEINYDLGEEDKERVDYILSNFIDKSASNLEALTTIDFIANNVVKEDDDQKIIDEVKRIKGNKFSDQALIQELETLKLHEFIS